MSNSPPGPGPNLFFAGGECLTRYGVWVRRTDPDLEEATQETHTRNSDATAFGRDGILRTWGFDTPRAEWLNEVDIGIGTDLDRKFPALLLEEASENDWSNSEAPILDWSFARVTLADNSSVAPDGATSADKLAEDSTPNSTHVMFRVTPTLSDNQLSTVSFYARAAGRNFVQVTTVDKAGGTGETFFDLINGTVGTTDPLHLLTLIRALPDNWFRISLTFDSSSGGTGPAVNVFLAESDGVISYSGDGVSGVDIWGFQFEVGKSVGSSYIRTGAVAVNRLADNFFGQFPHPPIEMTLYAKFIESGSVQIPSARILQVGSADNAEPKLFVRESGGFYQARYSTTPAVSDSTAAVASAIGDLVELRVTLTEDASIQLHQTLNGGSEVSASAGAALGALEPAWFDSTFFLNSFNNALFGIERFLSVKAHRGLRDQRFMRGL